jgi:hypothetical protein
MSRPRGWAQFVAVVLLAAVANAGLMVTWFLDMERLVAVPLDDTVVFVGVVVVGLLLALVLDDFARGAIALVVASALGAVIFGLAVSAPGFVVDEVRVTLINRGTTFGLAALLFTTLFGLIGMAAGWVIDAFGQRGKWE